MSILVGTFGLIHSQLTGMVYPELIPVYTALLGVPVIAKVIESRNSKKPPKDSS